MNAEAVDLLFILGEQPFERRFIALLRCVEKLFLSHGESFFESLALTVMETTNIIFRQLFDAESSTYTYLIGDPSTRQAVLIDPVLEQVERDLQFVNELDLTLTHVFDTHVHADHVTASGVLREKTGCTVIGAESGASCANVHVRGGETLRVGELEFKVLATPGHTDDSLSYLLGDRVFTGDALLVRATGRTDFQNGDAGQLFDSITRVLFLLPDETLVYPAHDYKGRSVTTVREEKQHNPRIAGKRREEFIQIMENLQLPMPKLIDIAVLANRACGSTEPRKAVQDISLSQLEQLGGAVRRIDVREPDEFTGPLGHLPGAELVPLGNVETALDPWPRDQPIVLICRSGRRSASAAQALAARGFTRLYNLAGGMLAVRQAAQLG